MSNISERLKRTALNHKVISGLGGGALLLSVLGGAAATVSAHDQAKAAFATRTSNADPSHNDNVTAQVAGDNRDAAQAEQLVHPFEEGAEILGVAFVAGALGAAGRKLLITPHQPE